MFYYIVKVFKKRSFFAQKIKPRIFARFGAYTVRKLLRKSMCGKGTFYRERRALYNVEGFTPVRSVISLTVYCPVLYSFIAFLMASGS